jgi:glycosyl hydrolase family 12
MENEGGRAGRHRADHGRGYPSIYQGCHWGNCTSGGLSGNPVQASAITAGKVSTSWSTTQPGTGAYDVAYDIWFNQTPTTSGQPNGTELMIWLNHNGSVQPFGSQVATGTSIGGRGYNVWFGTQGWNTVSYTMTTAATSVSGLDLAPLVQDAISRGDLPGQPADHHLVQRRVHAVRPAGHRVQRVLQRVDPSRWLG